jgi:hypothetical protein
MIGIWKFQRLNKVCVVPPRTLARGLKCRPRCIPGLISAEIRHRACFCRSDRAHDRSWSSPITVRRFDFGRTAWGIFRSPPLSLQTPPTAKGRCRSPACNPIDQDFRVLDHDQGREILLSPWTVPSTSLFEAGPQPGSCVPGPAGAPPCFPEVHHGIERQRYP